MSFRLSVLARCAVCLVGWSLHVSVQALGGSPGVPSGGGNSEAVYTQTRYPLVLVHGLFGWESLGPVEYFYGIPQALRDGGATVYTPKVTAAQTSEVRGEQLLAELRRLKAAYGHARFNLIGHSHGSHAVRYVAAVAPDLVASVLAVGGPNRGTVVADAVRSGVDGTGTTAQAASVFNVLGRVIDAMGGGIKAPQNSEGAMRSLTTAGSADFNRRFPQGAPTSACGSGPGVVNGIRYYSASGTGVLTHLFDPDSALATTSVLFRGLPNDGLVERCSSHWGVVLRDDYPWNHADEINQSLGLRGLGTPDPVAFYRTHANRLKMEGL